MPNMATKLAACITVLVGLTYAAPAPLSATIPAPPPALPSGVVSMSIKEVAGGGLPNASAPVINDADGKSGFQLLQYLENLEAYYYYEGLQNLTTKWNISGLPEDALNVVAKIAAVSCSSGAVACV